MPDRESIQRWLAMFQKKYSFNFQYSLPKLATELLGNNFGDIETFALTVMRRFVLSFPNGDVKDFVKEELGNLKLNVTQSEK